MPSERIPGVRILQRVKHLLQAAHARVLMRIVRMYAGVHLVSNGTTLIIAPHQDDETLGCGGLIRAKLQTGARVLVVFLTDGSRGADRALSCVEGLSEERDSEALRAASALGLMPGDLHFWNFQDGNLDAVLHDKTSRLIPLLARLLGESEAAEVYVPHRMDGHPDHEAAYQITIDATRQSNRQVRVLQYPVWLWWSSPFFLRTRPADLMGATLLHLDAALPYKKAALSCYQSQVHRFSPGFCSALLDNPEIFFETRERGNRKGDAR